MADRLLIALWMLTVSLLYTLNVQVPPEHIKGPGALKKKKIQIVPFSLQKVKFLQDKCKTESVSVSISTSTYLPISLSISKIPTDGDCSHEIRRRLLLGRKAMTNLDSVLQSRDIILPTKVHIVKAMVFPVVMCSWESWTLKKAEHQKLDTCKLWYCRGLLKISWTPRRSNQSILREINPEYSLEGLMLKLKLQYFGHLTGTDNFIGKVPDTGKDWGQKEERASEDEMGGWHLQCNEHELGQTSGDDEGQGP